MAVYFTVKPHFELYRDLCTLVCLGGTDTPPEMECGIDLCVGVTYYTDTRMSYSLDVTMTVNGSQIRAIIMLCQPGFVLPEEHYML